ncbi:MAG: peptidylprolyl isomerase [Burkholderiales bacterium]|nr:peptidylprolyl isomerase [Burkholderiales bacterium]
MAAQARAEKLDQNPKTKALLAAEIDRFYAGLHMNKVEQDAAEAFTKREVEYTARAKEIYITDRKKYETPEQVSAAHILFDLKNHSQEEGLKLAQETRKKILAGADFGKVAKQISEDRGSANRMGDLGWFSYEVMVPEFSKVAFSLKNAGDVSEPVLTGFGWHLILLKGKKEAGLMPLEKAQEKIMEEQKQKFVEEYINRELAKIDDDSKAVLNEAAIDALYVAPPSSEALKQLMPEMTKKSEAKSGQ